MEYSGKTVSVIIPMYNSEATIEKVLDSVKNQTAIDQILEIIIINDGSTDASLEVVEKYIENNRSLPIIVINQKNSGVSVARNNGMKRAAGEFIALIDSDDIWRKDKIEQQLKVFAKYPDIYFLGTGVQGEKLKIFFKEIHGVYKANPRDVCWKSFPTTPSVMFKKAAISEVGYFDENRKYGEDIEYFQRFFEKLNFYYLAKPLVKIGINKKFYGQKGLTSNLKEMHIGRQINLEILYKKRLISRKYYLFMKQFNKLKYIRRCCITRIETILQ